MLKANWVALAKVYISSQRYRVGACPCRNDRPSSPRQEGRGFGLSVLLFAAVYLYVHHAFLFVTDSRGFAFNRCTGCDGRSGGKMRRFLRDKKIDKDMSRNLAIALSAEMHHGRGVGPPI